MEILRPLTPEDVEPVVDLQREAALVAFVEIFPPAEHPYPTEEMRAGWLRELADPEHDCLAVLDEGELAGFVVLRGPELLHFGTALGTWGSGLADRAHAAALGRLRSQGHARTQLWVLADNRRARRFYERRGWVLTDEVGTAEFPPYPELRRYRRELGDLGRQSSPVSG